MRVRLRQLGGKRCLRTEYVDGEAVYPPTEGCRFVLFSKEEKRAVITSEVTEIRADGVFATETGSLYRLDVIDGPFLLGYLSRRSAQA